LAPNDEVLMHKWHRDLPRMGARSEAFQKRLRREGVIIASPQEPPSSQAVLIRMRGRQNR
jgi:hypothetical protein